MSFKIIISLLISAAILIWMAIGIIPLLYGIITKLPKEIYWKCKEKKRNKFNEKKEEHKIVKQKKIEVGEFYIKKRPADARGGGMSYSQIAPRYLTKDIWEVSEIKDNEILIKDWVRGQVRIEGATELAEEYKVYYPEIDLKDLIECYNSIIENLQEERGNLLYLQTYITNKGKD
jgi:hypothetical protein